MGPLKQTETKKMTNDSAAQINFHSIKSGENQSEQLFGVSGVTSKCCWILPGYTAAALWTVWSERGGANAHLPVFIGPLCRRWISAQVTAGHYRNNPAFSPLNGRQTAKNATQMLRVDRAR